MHFWIDKRSQCVYTGRHRVPTSLSSGVGRGRPGGRKGMSAGAHRFTAVATVEPPRRLRPARDHYQRTTGAAGTHPLVHGGGASTRRPEEGGSLFVEMPPSPASPPSPPQPTIASLAAARSVTPDTLLRTAALGLHHSPMMAPHLKFGMLVSFALATIFLAGAKYYFDRQVVRGGGGGGVGAGGAGAGGGGGGMSGGEAGVVVVVVAGAAGLACALTACRNQRPPPPPLPPDRVSSTALRHRHRADRTEEGPDDMSSAGISTTSGGGSGGSGGGGSASGVSRAVAGGGSGGNMGAGSGVNVCEAPPPYHIAVLLPGRGDSPPPPAYSALS